MNTENDGEVDRIISIVTALNECENVEERRRILRYLVDLGDGRTGDRDAWARAMERWIAR